MTIDIKAERGRIAEFFSIWNALDKRVQEFDREYLEKCEYEDADDELKAHVFRDETSKSYSTTGVAAALLRQSWDLMDVEPRDWAEIWRLLAMAQAGYIEAVEGRAAGRAKAATRMKAEPWQAAIISHWLEKRESFESPREFATVHAERLLDAELDDESGGMVKTPKKDQIYRFLLEYQRFLSNFQEIDLPPGDNESM